MCTVTYLPYGTNGFILTHSRDEKTIRSVAHPPRTHTLAGQPVTFPQDPQGRGTWIAVGPHRTVCLLNGAFVAHRPGPDQPRHSRGLVVLHSFRYETPEAFIQQYSLAGIDPFTLLMAEYGRLTELRWTGKRLAVSEIDPHRPHIWSSVTLYPRPVITRREGWFRQWQHQGPYCSPTAIREFHLSAGEGDPENAVQMRRQNQYLTVSLTQVIHLHEQTELVYIDLIQQTTTQQTLLPDYATV